jgi:uncharacterized membrane protein
VVAGLALASFRVYVGRFLRFSAASCVSTAGTRSCAGRLGQVIHANLENPLQHPRLIASLLALTASLTIGYLVVHSAAGSHLELDRD